MINVNQCNLRMYIYSGLLSVFSFFLCSVLPVSFLVDFSIAHQLLVLFPLPRSISIRILSLAPDAVETCCFSSPYQFSFFPQFFAHLLIMFSQFLSWSITSSLNMKPKQTQTNQNVTYCLQSKSTASLDLIQRNQSDVTYLGTDVKIIQDLD